MIMMRSRHPIDWASVALRAHIFGSDCNFCGKKTKQGIVMETLVDAG
jgi:hypothetical protein